LPKSSTGPPPKLSAEDRELIQVLLDDVGVLESLLLGGPPSPQQARATFGPVLRRWIVEGLFHRVQKLANPHAIKFPLRSEAQSVKFCQAGIFVHWMGQIEIGTLGVGIRQVAPEYIPEQQKYGLRATEPAPQVARQFFGQKMFYWKGRFYTRADVITWLANRLGGAHLDFRRKDDETHIDELKNYFGVEVRGTHIDMLVGDGIARGRADAARRPRIYDAPEIIAIDTARIFAAGIRASEAQLAALLA